LSYGRPRSLLADAHLQPNSGRAIKRFQL